MIEVSNLIKDYGSFRALSGVSFSMKKGEILGFLGPNGAGKSTTMKVLTGFISADGGTATVAGHDVMNDSIAVRRQLGYLPENTPIYEEMGVVEFLRFIAGVRRVPRGKVRERLDTVIGMCGLASMTGKLIGELSRGYRQRVGLAQALIHDPPILIMDEPTSALDPSQTVEIRELVREIGREKSVLLSTHIMGEATATCDRVIIISRGRIVAEGTPESLVRSDEKRRGVLVEARASAEDLRGLLGGLAGVANITEKSAAADGWASCRAIFDAPATDPRETIFAAVREKGWELRELHEETMTLEEFFIKVTTQS